MKRTLVVLSLIIAMAASLVAVGSANTGAASQVKQRKSERALEDQNLTLTQQQALARLGKDVEVELTDQGIPSSLTGKLSARLHIDDPVAEARGALETFASAFRVGSNDGFTYSGFRPDRTGGAYVQMTQTYKGIPVVGGELTVRLSKDEVVGIKGRFVPDLNLDIQPALTKDEAKAIVESRNAEGIGAKGSVEEAGNPVIYINESGVARLAIPVRVEQAKTAQAEEVFVDTKDGVIVGRRAVKMKKQSSQDFVLNSTDGFNFLKDGDFECGPDGAGCGLADSPWEARSTTAFATKKVRLLTGEVIEILDTTYIPPPASWFRSNDDLITSFGLTHDGSYAAFLGGWGSIRQDVVSQCITLPRRDPIENITRASLSLWITILTDERPGRRGIPATGTDYMFVEILDCHDNLKGVLGVYNSFYPAAPPFINQSGDISSFLGQTIKIRFRSFENNSRPTSFFIDDLVVSTF